MNQENQKPLINSSQAKPVSRTQWLTKEELVEFSTLNPYRLALDLSLTWFWIILILQLALWINLLPIYVLAFILIACSQNALTLWAHEASHYSLTRSKQLNDQLGDLLVAGPLGMTVGQYRWHHVLHHMYLNDPEREVNPLAWICIRGSHLFKEVLLSLAGKYGVQAVTRYGASKDNPKFMNRPGHTPASLAGFVAVNGVLFLWCALQGQWWVFFALWIAPIFTLTIMIGNFRTIVEHQASSDVCDVGMVPLPPITRIIRSHPVERILIAPVGLYYHYEHHMFPSIPYHRLGDIRKLLQQRGFFESNEVVYGDGYIRTLLRIAMQPGYGIRLLNPFLTIEDDHNEHEITSDNSPVS